MRGTRLVFPEMGRVEIEEFDVPSVGPHGVLIRTESSLISAGTELSYLTGALRAEQFPVYPGYSNVGIAEEVGEAVTACEPGDRVLTLGRHASHVLVDLSGSRPGSGQYVQTIPEGVDPELATFAILGSVAMHGIRRAEPQLKQSAVVVGLGVVGQLIAQLARIAGCSPVIGVDVVPLRLEKASQSGGIAVINADECDVAVAVRQLTSGSGADLAFDATRNPKAILTLMDVAAQSGKVIVVGSIPGTVEMPLFDPLQTKELTIIGVLQPRAPIEGHAYFPWTQSRNRLNFLELMRDGLVKVDHLITHHITPNRRPRPTR